MPPAFLPGNIRDEYKQGSQVQGQQLKGLSF